MGISGYVAFFPKEMRDTLQDTIVDENTKNDENINGTENTKYTQKNTDFDKDTNSSSSIENVTGYTLQATNGIENREPILQNSDDIQTISTVLTVDGTSYTANVPINSTVYDMMNAIADESLHFTFGGTNFGPGMGFFVDSINGKKEDHKNKLYWVYKINGKKAMVGVSGYLVKEGDIISWALEDEES